MAPQRRLRHIEVNVPSATLIKSPFGPVALVWSVYQDRPMILGVILSKPGISAKLLAASRFPGYKSNTCRVIDTVADRISAFLTGDNVRFSLDLIRLDICSRFQQNVLLAEHAIPRGRVSTYQRIARKLGSPEAARAVGAALAANPFPLVIPCHRAIRSDGTLGGFQGGLEMKRRLLQMEGLRFDSSGRVDTTAFFY